jgi:hypothetical protein
MDRHLCQGMFRSGSTVLEESWYTDDASYFKFGTPNSPVRLLLHFNPPCARTVEFTPPDLLTISVTKDAVPDGRLGVTAARVACSECANCLGPVEAKTVHYCPDCVITAADSDAPVHFHVYCTRQCMRAHNITHRRSYCQCRTRGKDAAVVSTPGFV